MEALTKRLKEAAALCRKYGVNSGGLDEARARDFRLRVAVLGAFNTGKSTLVNALLGASPAPASLTGETGLPAEFFYGPAQVTLVRDGRETRSDLSVLSQTPPEGVSLARVRLPVPGLADLPDVSVLDTPGIGGPACPALPGLVRSAGACVLVFGADAPVITESLAAFLSALDLAGRPLLCVLTKCDPFSPRQLDQIAAQLAEHLRDQLGLDRVDLCRVRRGETPPQAVEFLRRAQMQAAAARADRVRQLVLQGAAPLERYLTERLETQQLLEPELARRADALARQLDRMHATADRLRQGAAQLLENAADAAALHSRETLAPLAGPLADLLRTGQDPALFADGAVLCVIRAEARSRLRPVLEAYEKALRRLASLHGAQLPACPQTGEEAADEAFPGTRELFSEAGQDPDALLSALVELVRQTLARAGQTAADRLQEALGGPLYAQMASLQKALEDARARQQAEAEEQRRTREEWQRDLERLRALTEQAEEECTHVV